MILINKSDESIYSGLAHRTLGPRAASADIGEALFKAIKDILFECGNGAKICVKATDLEKKSLQKLMEVIAAGDKLELTQAKPKTGNDVLKELMAKEEAIKQAKMEAIQKAREREASIMSETRYTSKEDMDSARTAAARIGKKVVTAKEMDTVKMKSNDVSLMDVMGNNRFIEENMSSTRIPTVVADGGRVDSGWDKAKIEKTETVTPAAPTAPTAPTAPATSATPAKRGRKKAK